MEEVGIDPKVLDGAIPRTISGGGAAVRSEAASGAFESQCVSHMKTHSYLFTEAYRDVRQ